ncbi:uncharacterized protein C8Q71DRAFT_106740 [Rhodofomes roseus]|uniref:Uncharacterized protein n=1 Tax=Rhodofomes roseus TaxID=34475 RepID=A0ABQ8KDH1_9APHY|nr:uncharacterized protein C8Q71DRAFT_106740 [Rhodofomes roseus]KAH9835159.1 hypothetical protein C8Q71DRAFT_106740 [Rhodofomes roseus]
MRRHMHAESRGSCRRNAQELANIRDHPWSCCRAVYCTRGLGLISRASYHLSGGKKTYEEAATPCPWIQHPPFRLDAPITLPRLTLQCDAHVVVLVYVEEMPVTGEGKANLTWVVKTRPIKQLGKRQHLTLEIDSQRSGVGKLTSVVELRRHWILFTVSGGPFLCNLRVPVPWAALDDLESFTHSKLYFTLPVLPRPHEEFRRNPLFTNDEENPYAFEPPERGASELEPAVRLARITCQWKPPSLDRSVDSEGEVRSKSH